LKYLLDTCLISELIKKTPEPSILSWISSMEEHHLYISVLTLGEIQKGISRLVSSKRKHSLQSWLNEDLRNRFENRVLEITPEIALVWGEIQGKAENEGAPLPVIDALLAATALIHEMTIVTRNQKDMRRSGVKILNPWS